MRGVVRWVTVCGALMLAVGIWASATGTAKVAPPAASTPGAMRLSLIPRAAGGHLLPQSVPGNPPLYSSTLAGYATFLTGSTTTTTTFKPPKPTCTTSDSGIAPGTFVDAGPTTGETLDAAGVLDQCIGGKIQIRPALVVSGIETNYTNIVHVGDSVQTTVTVGSGGTTVTVQDLTPSHTFTQTENGTDTASDAEIAAVDSTEVNSVPVPIGTVKATFFTGTTVDGTAIGQQNSYRVLLNSGCSVLLSPGGLDSTGENFDVKIPPVIIDSLTPGSGTTGTSVQIDGTGFNSTSTVKFGAVVATSVTHTSSTELQAVVPTTARTSIVTVKNTATPIGAGSSACDFLVAPTITSFTPPSGITGSTVTINGSGLAPDVQVLFGSRSGHATFVSSTQLQVTVPNAAVTAPITVSTPAGTASTTTNFTPTLSITKLAPRSGPFGTIVHVYGVGFTNTSTVDFNGVAASKVVFVSSTQLKATVPSAATTGPVTVTNTASPAGTVQGSYDYTVTPHVAPTVTSFTPTSGPVGTPVTITGTAFSGASTVMFGTVKASSFQIVSDTEITTTVPTGAVTAPISVTTAAGTGTSSTSFTVS